MSIHQLAPVSWQLGQTLLPEHLLAQETALTGEIRLRYHVNGLPGYGISKLEWDEYLLAKGNLRIKALGLFTRNKSTLIDFPGNADIISLPVEFADSGRAKIFYFVLQIDQETNQPQLHLTAKAIPRRLFKIVLSQLPNLPEEYNGTRDNHSVIEQGKLAEFVQTPSGQWKLSERYIPPLLQIGACEFMQSPLQQLKVLLDKYLAELKNIYEQQLPELRRFEIKHCANQLIQTRQYLANHLTVAKNSGEIRLHPYFLYMQLQQLDGELGTFRGEWLNSVTHNYKHDDLHGTFKRVFRSIISQLTFHSRNNQCVELILKDGCYQAILPATLEQYDRLFLVINCAQQPSIKDEQLPCLSSYRRMPILFNYSLSGAPLKTVKHSALTHFFGQNSQGFELMAGEEFTHIKHDRSVAFLAQPEFEHYNFYILCHPDPQNDSRAG
ncbi:type VI secretion system baseplate subunit TssK [Paraglaciecola marina]|uniref:type VI secretion system baseplate subunit TssK n=1 Tax=Paraglaciecola marina TaxID=2500157 RepID=UPI00105CB5B9|nr:type VI secretion system baseplate subunit TssK [Paraglaciecola marina]